MVSVLKKFLNISLLTIVAITCLKAYLNQWLLLIKWTLSIFVKVVPESLNDLGDKADIDSNDDDDDDDDVDYICLKSTDVKYWTFWLHFALEKLFVLQ